MVAIATLSLTLALEKHQLYAVVWDDAQRITGEVEPHEVPHKPCRIVSIGVLLRSDGSGVSLAGEVMDDGRYRDIDFIPRGMIIEEWPLGALRKQRTRRKRDQPAQAPCSTPPTI